MYKFLKKLFGRTFFLVISVLFQILWFCGFMYLLGSRYPILAGTIRVLAVIAVFTIMNKRNNPSYKLAWCITILALPIVGYSLYLMFGSSRMQKQVLRRCEVSARLSRPLLPEKDETREALRSLDERINKQSVYMRDYAGFPVYQHTRTRYFPEGESLYRAMIDSLREAEHFIFMEYFIIDNGEVWKSVLDILEEKARQGLDVRLIYDDVGTVGTLPAGFYHEIRARGIQCEVFNPFKPIVSVVMNNRDHRKIMVIDGHTGFTGGINLADEYINKKKRFGYWKDTGVMLRGEAVWNFTVMFLQMWSVVKGTALELEAQNLPYHPQTYTDEVMENDGFVQPYSDTPVDQEVVGENVYLNIIGNAKRYVYIFTPYLIIDNEMMTAICLAAKSGVDIRIVTPGIPDKKMVFLLSRSYYEQLIDAGVRIYEYQPGFLHAKSFVCDDEVAVVGTINLDYRSLFLHFECGVWMYRSGAVMQVKDDVRDVLRVSKEITKEECVATGLVTRLSQIVLRFLAPML